jgi:hypothetical protein
VPVKVVPAGFVPFICGKQTLKRAYVGGLTLQVLVPYMDFFSR